MFASDMLRSLAYWRPLPPGWDINQFRFTTEALEGRGPRLPELAYALGVVRSADAAFVSGFPDFKFQPRNSMSPTSTGRTSGSSSKARPSTITPPTRLTAGGW